MDEPQTADEALGLTTPRPRNKPRTTSAPKKPKRERGRKTGPVEPREMTKVRDEIKAIRDIAKEGVDSSAGEEIYSRLVALYETVDSMDLRFIVHWDPSTKKQK
jgi:hypothetical protein